MKVLRKGFEKEVICPRCKAVLLYTHQDIDYVGDMEGEWNCYCVKCPECNQRVRVKVTKITL